MIYADDQILDTPSNVVENAMAGSLPEGCWCSFWKTIHKHFLVGYQPDVRVATQYDQKSKKEGSSGFPSSYKALIRVLAKAKVFF